MTYKSFKKIKNSLYGDICQTQIKEVYNMEIKEIEFDDLEELEEAFAPAWGFGCGGAILNCC